MDRVPEVQMEGASVLEALTEEAEAATGGSLRDRMAARANELELHQTEVFELPGWEGVLAVELKALGYTTIRKINERLQKIMDPGVRDLYSIADQIGMATVQLYEVDGNRRTPTEGWAELAKLLPHAPDGITTRQAILLLLPENRIHFFVQDWLEWARAVRVDVDEEVVADFGGTG